MKTHLTAMTKTQLADLYEIHRKTLVARHRKAGIPLENGIVMPKTIRLIFDHFGDPRGEREK